MRSCSLFFRCRSFPPWWQLAFPFFLTTAIIFLFFFQRNWSPLVFISRSTILDKTVEKIVYLGNIFLNIIAVPVLPSPPSPESNVVVYSKESLIPGRLWEATLNWGKGFSFRKGVVLKIVLLRRKVDMMGKTFSSSFVRDCSFFSVGHVNVDIEIKSKERIGFFCRCFYL